MKKIRVIFYVMCVFCILSATGCSAPARLVSATSKGEPVPYTEAIHPTTTFTPFQPATETRTPSFTFTSTPLPTWTQTPTATQTPSPTPTDTWTFNEAGKVIAPILLYHHVADITPSSRYYVSPENFRLQMQALKAWGCTSITPSYLRQVLVKGGDLPYRPIVLTFDDGNIDIFENAFPIMQEFGFVGTFYIVTNRLKSAGYVNAEQLKEMVAAGWEMGSHSESHIDLTVNHDSVYEEMMQSRLDLQEAVSVTVTSFAYPYGTVDAYIATQAQNYGYLTGMGLGILTEHTWGSMYYLNRREVEGDMDLTAFAGLLPWSLVVTTPGAPVASEPTLTQSAGTP